MSGDNDLRTSGSSPLVIQSLIERLEKATGPDRELDATIYEIVNGVSAYRETVPYSSKSEPQRRMRDVPAYTGSLDAAMTLVPNGYDWTLEADAAWVRWMGKEDVEEAQGVLFRRGGECTAIALCIAVLKARAASEASDHQRGTRAGVVS